MTVPKNPKISIVTPSYAREFDLASDLCRSIDRFVSPEIDHFIVVPQRDIRLFSSLLGTRRQVVSQERLLPWHIHRAPLPYEIVIGSRRKRLGEKWFSPYHGFVGGWIIQQVIKLAAPVLADSDVFLFVDSDIVFVRPFRLSQIVNGERVRLYRWPGAGTQHAKWHATASRLLGLEYSEYFGADYIGPVISWHAETLRALHRRLSQQWNRDWRDVVLGERELSEYILYGVFADHVLKDSESHFGTELDLAHCMWFPPTDNLEILQFVHGLSSDHIAVCIQSTTGLSLERRRAIIEQIVASIPIDERSHVQ